MKNLVRIVVCVHLVEVYAVRIAAVISPQRIEDLSYDYLKNKILETGCISIDWFEGDPRRGEYSLKETLYLRMRNRKRNNVPGFETILASIFQEVEFPDLDEPADIVDPSWGGTCVLHNKDTGCSIPYEKRPKGARWLIAKTTENGRCEDGYSKQQCAIDWIPYQKTLLKLRDYFMEHPDVPFNNK